ncbi:protein SEMI-ROLLED LEAF 2 isoform X1 [Arachis duranensis]|uniref:Protein SEMI-ROLLED LEAF 2 isoform X1 n=1 Tax=Arachis duranensis TaxID=130453 RepID=A0A6P4CL09_ARADU|nr:protein SEMI-ROLLED LEAF 2 isoform X1 [Arachis duranensis]
MGVMSRRVVPACGNLCCVVCPAMRASSRQPVKRYKKLLADIFPRNQEAELNDRKIGKLCEYASKNPLRIPKITENLEQRCYKDLRNEMFGSVKVVLCIYRKFLSSCKEQMPLYASSLLAIIRTLLEQSRTDEIRILGCNTLVDFIECQTDGTYVFNLEGFILKLCQLAQEVGKDERALHLCSVGLQALSYMVRFMGEHSHLSMDFDDIISVTLENYMNHQSNSNNVKEDNLNSVFLDSMLYVLFYSSFSTLDHGSSIHESKHPLCVHFFYRDTARDPTYWSKVCLYNMVKVAREATTLRRFLEPVFHNFDIENQWPSENGTASSVLMYLQSLLEESGDNSHLLLSILVKHLDHKNVAKQPIVKTNIVNTITQLAQNMKQHASVATIGAISDLVKHLRRCLQNSAEASCIGNDGYKLNAELQSALEMCILQLSKKVGDVGPILDLLAAVLENISNNTIIARTTISAVYQTAKLITSIPNVSYHKKAFPDALFHQLLLAMAHPDHETRIGAHSVFSIVLMPSVFSSQLDQKKKIVHIHKVSREGFSIQHDGFSGEEHVNGKPAEGNTVAGFSGKFVVHPHCDYSFSSALTNGKDELSSFRLSSHQVSLLLSLIWVQATSAENGPANFEAMAHTYSIVLLFTRSKTSGHMALVRCFQLAFSLRSISLDTEGGLQPSRRRSLFTLASYMLIFSARAGSFPELIPKVKASLTETTVDPFLELVDDVRLQAMYIEPGKVVYGSLEDDIAAGKSLSALQLDDKQLKETVKSYFLTKYSKLPEDDLSSIKEQLLQGFSPDDAYPLGPPLFMETPRPCSPLAQIEFPDFNEIVAPVTLADEEIGPERGGSQSDRMSSLSIHNPDILSVNQLLESVLETARQVASVPISSAPVPYDQMKNQCEALVTGKQQKMSVLQSFKHQQETRALVLSSDYETKVPPLSNKTLEYSDVDLKLVSLEQFQPRYQVRPCSYDSLRLPPSSPYDKFLKAAGC